MERERWAQVRSILSNYFDLESGERDAYLTQVCASDSLLLAEVQSMVNSHDELGSFLETPVFGRSTEELLPESRIGNYLVRELIAEGGMGTVYRAVRSSDFEKQVAVKLVKRGMDTDFILRRFWHERQILAGLDHPNIARLLDGGAAEDGRPYLVMEYIEGKPITDYAEAQSLGIRERLGLFRTVCDAVQYAHQRLVVHRDLKPGNILVTADGAPKLLDFGIAKLLQPEADATLTSIRMMTPECASPEQVRGQPITTASDVYSLGVLLYHLLTGNRPYQFTTRSPEEVVRVVCETEPARPSTLRPLPGDLDNVVLKAMHKEPERRYASAGQFGEDIRRFLEGLPVIARKDTFRYRARKFVSRHLVGSIAAAAVVLSLTGGLAASLWEAHAARMERTRAETRFKDVRELAHSVIFEFHDAIKDLPGSTPVRKLFIDRGVHYLDNLVKESAGDPALQRDVAAAYERVGLVQGQYGAANLGDSGGALQSLRKALQVRQAIARSNPANAADIRSLASSHRLVAVQLLANGSPSGALAEIQRATQLSEGLQKRGVRDVETLDELASDYDSYGLIQGGSPGSLGDTDGAVESFRKAVAANGDLLRMSPLNEDVKRAVEINYVHLGTVLSRKGRPKECLINQQKALQLAKELAAGSSSSARKRDVAVAYSHLADCYEGLGDVKQTLASYAEGRKIYLAVAAADPRNETMQNGLAVADLNVGSFLAQTGHAHEGLALMDDGVRIKEKLVAGDPENLIERNRLAQFYGERSEARQRLGMLSGALRDSQNAFASWRVYSAKDQKSLSASFEGARYQLAVAQLSDKLGLSDQAEAGYQEVLRICDDHAGGIGTAAEGRKLAAEAYLGLGDIAKTRGSDTKQPIEQRVSEWSAARSFYRTSIDLQDLTSKLGKVNKGDPNPAARRIAECDRQLSRLLMTPFPGR